MSIRLPPWLEREIQRASHYTRNIRGTNVVSSGNSAYVKETPRSRFRPTASASPTESTPQYQGMFQGGVVANQKAWCFVFATNSV